MNHTSGPWKIQDLGPRAGYPNWKSFAVRSEQTNVHIATVGNVDRYYEGKEEANARLIAAAPKLLAACERMTKFAYSHQGMFSVSTIQGIIDEMGQAIAETQAHS